jgi:dCTP deaminase
MEYIENSMLRIEPFSADSLGPAGYDLRAGSNISIPPAGCVLVHTLEFVELGSMVCGDLFLRSSFAREGIIGSFALVDPGFRGQLTLSLTNMGQGAVDIAEGERLAQIVFLKLDRPPKKIYSGRYQNSKGAVASKRGFKQTYKLK